MISDILLVGDGENHGHALVIPVNLYYDAAISSLKKEVISKSHKFHIHCLFCKYTTRQQSLFSP